MNQYVISSYEDIEHFINQHRHPLNVLQFRGQACNDCGWSLKSTLARQVNTPVELVTKQKEIINEFQKRIKAANLEHALLISKNPRFYQPEWEMLQQAQHYELPTMLMDFSLDWRRSLYFAVFDEKMDTHDGQLWIYQAPYEVLMADNSDDEDGDYFRISPFACSSPIIANPAFYWGDNVTEQIAAQRRWLQMGRFLVQSPEESLIPMEENSTFDPYLLKIIIPANRKPAIREMLTKSNLSIDYLYFKKDPTIEAIVKDLKK